MQTMQKEQTGAVAPVNPPRRRAPWPIEFYRSAVGKKWVMAITGIMLMGFVFFHMVGNLKIYEGASAMNAYGAFLREILYPLVPKYGVLWIMRIGLIVAFVLHIHSAASLTLMNRRANAGGYIAGRDFQAANYASRSMRLTGVVILAFVLFHLADLTWGWIDPDFVYGDVYRNVQSSLTGIVPATIYIVANLALGMHLFHGAWSMFQSLGLNNPKYNSWRRNFAVGFAAVVVVGNLSFPLTIVTGAVDDDVCYESGDRIVTCEAVFADALRAGEMTVEDFDELTTAERDRIMERDAAERRLADDTEEAGS